MINLRLCISNPPYNLKWKHPTFGELDPRFTVLPKENNANHAFIQLAINQADMAVLILPNCILHPSDKNDLQCIKNLVNKNLIDAIVMCPDSMFTSTSIPVCLLFLNRHKKNETIEMVDMSHYYALETREQKGQYGGKSHEGRIYKKQFKIFNQEHIDFILDCIKNRKKNINQSAPVNLNQIVNNQYDLSPSRYLIMNEHKNNHRPYEDIVNDLNYIIGRRNLCKLTINETLAKNIGLYFVKNIDMSEINTLLEKICNKKIEKDSHIVFTKNAILKFENQGTKEVSPILMMIISGYKQYLYEKNIEENRLLVELRDALLPELMNGDIKI